MQGFIAVTCSFWDESELDLHIICLSFMTNIINYVTGLAETKNVHKTSLSLKIVRISFLMLQKSEEKMGKFSQEVQYKQTCQVSQFGRETPGMQLILPPSWYITKISR